jgi:hypothetical protein
VEDRYSSIFKLEWQRPAAVADGLAELQVRWPAIPLVFCETRQLAEEWTYRYLAAAATWAADAAAARDRIGGRDDETATSAPHVPDPSAAELRAWARLAGFAVADRGRVPREVLEAWRADHRPGSGGRAAADRGEGG